MINYKKADLNDLDETIRCRMEFIREDMGNQTPEMEAVIQAQLQEYLTNHDLLRKSAHQHGINACRLIHKALNEYHFQLTRF